MLPSALLVTVGESDTGTLHPLSCLAGCFVVVELLEECKDCSI